MFGWRNNTSNIVTSTNTSNVNSTNLHDRLVANTAAYRRGRKTRVEEETKRVYAQLKDLALAFSKNNNTTIFYHNPVFDNLCIYERFEALENIRTLFLNNDGVECYIDGTTVKIIWRMPDQ